MPRRKKKTRKQTVRTHHRYVASSASCKSSRSTSEAHRPAHVRVPPPRARARGSPRVVFLSRAVALTLHGAGRRRQFIAAVRVASYARKLSHAFAPSSRTRGSRTRGKLRAELSSCTSLASHHSRHQLRRPGLSGLARSAPGLGGTSGPPDSAALHVRPLRAPLRSSRRSSRSHRHRTNSTESSDREVPRQSEAKVADRSRG